MYQAVGAGGNASYQGVGATMDEEVFEVTQWGPVPVAAELEPPLVGTSHPPHGVPVLAASSTT
jgi:hypothetical protein